MAQQINRQIKDGTLSHAKKAVPPIRRRLVPAVAIGLVGSLIVNNLRRATNEESRYKVLVRDVLVVAGTGMGLLAGIRFSKTVAAGRFMNWFSKVIGRGPIDVHDFEHMGMSKPVLEKLKSRFEASHAKKLEKEAKKLLRTHGDAFSGDSPKGTG